MVGKPADRELPEAVRSPYSMWGAVYRVAVAAWNSGVTPGVMARTLGPFSRHITTGYTQRRLRDEGGISKEDADAFEPYLFEILGAKGSGEVRAFVVLLDCSCCMRVFCSGRVSGGYRVCAHLTWCRAVCAAAHSRAYSVGKGSLRGPCNIPQSAADVHLWGERLDGP